MKVTSPALLAAAVHFELRPESTKLETLFKLLSALDLELHVVKRGSTLDDNKVWDREW